MIVITVFDCMITFTDRFFLSDDTAEGATKHKLTKLEVGLNQAQKKFSAKKLATFFERCDFELNFSFPKMVIH